MAKKQKQQIKTCSDCIHENACRIWTDGRFIPDSSASVCPSHETVKESASYLCGVLDERKRNQTNADRIRAMSDEELAEFLRFGYVPSHICFICGNTVPECNDNACRRAVLEWLQQPSEGE